MKERVLLSEGSYIWKETSIIRRSSIVETRVLLREGSSIRENKFSYDKEVSMEKGFLYEVKLYVFMKERLLL